MDIYSFKTGKSESIDEIPEGYTLLRESLRPSQKNTPSLEERITRLEIDSSYGYSTDRLIQMHGENLQIPKLVRAIGDLVNVMASQQQAVSTKETLNTEEAAKKLDCSPALVRDLAKSGKLPFILRGKNLKFRQADIEAFEASETRSGADMRKNSRKKLSVQNGRSTVEAEKRKEEKSESEEVFPSREEFNKLWR